MHADRGPPFCNHIATFAAPVVRRGAVVDFAQPFARDLTTINPVEACSGQTHPELERRVTDIDQADRWQEAFDPSRIQMPPPRQPGALSQRRPIGEELLVRAYCRAGRSDLRRHVQMPQQPVVFTTNQLSPIRRIAGKRKRVNSKRLFAECDDLAHIFRIAGPTLAPAPPRALKGSGAPDTNARLSRRAFACRP